MPNLSKYFNGQKEELHPKARLWRQKIRSGAFDRVECELWRRREGLSYAPAKLYVTFYFKGNAIETDHDDWDPDLNAELLQLGVKAHSPENESERLALMMREWFAIPQARFGDGFFNSVMYEHLRNSDFAHVGPVRDALNHIHRTSPNVVRPAHRECADEIERVLAVSAHTLTDDLRYGRAKAELILGNALAHYLDERFSISDRRLLGIG